MKLFADGNGYDSFTVPAGGSEMPASNITIESGQHFFQMDGHHVYNTAIEVIPAALKSVLSEAGLTADDIDLVVPHQPSIRILEESARRIGIPFEKFGTNMIVTLTHPAAQYQSFLMKCGAQAESGEVICLHL